MRKSYEVSVKILDGIDCKLLGNVLQCSKGNSTLSKIFALNKASMSLEGGMIKITSSKANKKDIANVNSYVAHLNNMFRGLNERYVYEMEVSNVHFPMTVKVDKNNLIISNFLGEKVPRKAKIIPGVEVKIEGTKIIVSSADIEKAGQTAANIEKASTVTKKDRRVFQDGIFITKKPGVEA